MTGVGGPVEQRLRTLVIEGDLEGLREYVDALGPDDRKAARAWTASPHDFDSWPGPPELAEVPPEDAYRRRLLVHSGRVLLIGRLEPPAAAAKRVMRLSWRADGVLRAPVVAAFVDRDRGWAGAFAAAADAIPVPAGGGGAPLAHLLRQVVLAHDLPVPTGRLFHANWVRVSPKWHGENALTEAVRADPLMPEMLYAQLASGESGNNPTLPDTVATLVSEGRVDRDRVLAVVLAHLTANQRVSSQRVLAGCATKLGLTSAEVPGGLPYLLGVLSTAHGSVAKVVLPLALELLENGEDLTGVATVVAGRSEKGLRQTLLKASSPARLGKRLDHADLVAAIDVLAEGEDDAALRDAWDRARSALGAAPAPPADTAPAATAMGLWDLEPAPLEPRPETRPYSPTLRDSCWLTMRTGDCTSDATLHDRLLDAIARSEITPTELLATAHELEAEGKLSATRAAAVLEPLFLGGALRTTWPVALRIADLCAARPRPAAGLDRLLRMLAQYAAEPPEPGPLPPHLARLAAGTSKASQEARHLGALLARTPPHSYDPGPAAAIEPRPDHLGLWREDSAPHPWSRRYTEVRDLSTIGQRVARTPLDHYTASGAVARSVIATLRLEEVVALVQEHGAEEVKAAIAAAPRYWPGPFAQAALVWAKGLLTPESYWTVVRDAVSAAQVREQWQAELGDHEGARQAHSWQAADGWAMQPPVLPFWWHDDPMMRLELLHTCEVLLVVERGGHLVSSPDVIDGSVGLPRLLERLERAPRVGPLDLRLALGRLRPTRPEEATRIAGGAATDPALTTPSADLSFAATDALRHWVGQGGLRLLPRPEVRPGVREYDAEAPVPWSSCQALAGTEAPDAPTGHWTRDTWALPGRPDLSLRHAFRASVGEGSVADVGGTIGPVGWRTILCHLGFLSGSYYPPDFDALVRLQDQGRLHPVPAAAAALSYWVSDTPDVIGQALGWERAFLRGALRGLWPVAVAIVEAGLARPERPPGLDALIDVMGRHVHEVPNDAVPSFLEAR